MKTRAVIAASVLLGLASPGLAHAQLIDNLVRKIEQQQPRRDDRGGGPRFEEPQRQQGRGRGGDRGGGNERGGGDDRDRDRPQVQAPPARLVPLPQVEAQIRRMVPGRLLDASPPSGGDRPVYRIRWQADNGQRIDFTVDARTGAVIGRSGG